METINITSEEFDSLIPLKKGIAHTDREFIYKKSLFSLKKLDILDIERETHGIDIPSLVLPEKKLTINNKEAGYVTKYYHKYYTLEQAFKKEKIKYSDKLNIIKILIDTVKKMHEAHIVHGDLHSENIIFNKNDLKIIDFDNARFEDYTDYRVYKYKKLSDTKCLVVNILNILSSSSSLNTDFKIIPFIELLNISDDFKSYLIDCISEKEKIEGVYPDLFIKELNGSVEAKAKSLVKGL